MKQASSFAPKFCQPFRSRTSSYELVICTNAWMCATLQAVLQNGYGFSGGGMHRTYVSNFSVAAVPWHCHGLPRHCQWMDCNERHCIATPSVTKQTQKYVFEVRGATKHQQYDHNVPFEPKPYQLYSSIRVTGNGYEPRCCLSSTRPFLVNRLHGETVNHRVRSVCWLTAPYALFEIFPMAITVTHRQRRLSPKQWGVDKKRWRPSPARSSSGAPKA